MSTGDEIVNLLEKGLVGWLALGFIFVDKTGLLEKFWNLFVKEREAKQADDNKFQQLAFKSVEKSVTEIPDSLNRVEKKLETATILSQASIDVLRSLMAETGLMGSKVDVIATQLDDVKSKLEIILHQLKTCPIKERAE